MAQQNAEGPKYNFLMKKSTVCLSEYAKKLEESGVPYELHLIKGAMHNFFAMPGKFFHYVGQQYSFQNEMIFGSDFFLVISSTIIYVEMSSRRRFKFIIDDGRLRRYASSW
jgi:acetyl esterase/lipase